MIEVIIPTRLPSTELRQLEEQIAATAAWPHRIVHTGCQLGSAAVNRNLGLSRCRGDAVVMVDDDVEFPSELSQGWLKVLAEALARPDVVMVSSQMYAPDGKYGYMTGLDDCQLPAKRDGETEVPTKRLLTACCGFKRRHRYTLYNAPIDLWFDEQYVGSGFEDVDFCNHLALAMPGGRFLVCHDAKAIHRNEAKEQRGGNWRKNEAYYKQKWGIE